MRERWEAVVSGRSRGPMVDWDRWIMNNPCYWWVLCSQCSVGSYGEGLTHGIRACSRQKNIMGLKRTFIQNGWNITWISLFMRGTDMQSWFLKSFCVTRRHEDSCNERRILYNKQITVGLSSTPRFIYIPIALYIQVTNDHTPYYFSKQPLFFLHTSLIISTLFHYLFLSLFPSLLLHFRCPFSASFPASSTPIQ